MSHDAMNNPNGEARFDAALRTHHQVAVERISPRVRAQLAQRRSAALRGEGIRRGHGIRYVSAGFAAIGALAIGLQQFGKPPTMTAPVTPASAMTTAANASSGTTMLDEDPEFYAWLASSDGQLVAME